MRCYICNCEITSLNRSFEHIFPNCIGGRSKSSKLMCHNCNSSFGANIDRELCNQLEIWSNLLNIKRARGDPPPINGRFKDTDTEISWSAGGLPVIKFKPKSEQVGEGQLKYEYSGNWENVQKFIGGLKQKHDNVVVGPIKRQNYNDLVEFEVPIDPGKLFPAICKMAINFYMLRGGDHRCIAYLIPYISKGEVGSNVFFYYPESSEQDTNKKYDVILHTISVRGDSAKRGLYAYVELFNAYKCLVILNEEYTGVDIAHMYSWDVLRCKEVNGSVPLNLSADQIFRIKSEYIFPPAPESLIVQLNRLLHTVVVKQRLDDISESLDRWMEDALTLYEGVPVTRDLLGKVAVGDLVTYDQLGKVGTGRVVGIVFYIEDRIRALKVQKNPNMNPHATKQFVSRMIDISIEIAKHRTIKKYPLGSPINRDLLFTFVLEFLIDMLPNLPEIEEEAMREFVNRAN